VYVTNTVILICFTLYLDKSYVIRSFDFEYTGWKLFQKRIDHTELDRYALLFVYSICFHNRQITHFTEHGKLCCCQLISLNMENYVVVNSFHSTWRIMLLSTHFTEHGELCCCQLISLNMENYVVVNSFHWTWRIMLLSPHFTEHGELCCCQLISRSMANYVVVSFCQIVSYVSTCSWPDIMVSS
jgi:hypothetical protein